MPLLKRGSRGPSVVRLQHLLNERLEPSPRLRADGIFGSRTDAAVRDFQTNRGLDVDGIVGPNTWGELRRGDRRVIRLPTLYLGRSVSNSTPRRTSRGTGTGGIGVSDPGPARTGVSGWSSSSEQMFLARLWDNLDRFTQVVGTLGSVPRDLAEQNVLPNLFRPGPVREGDHVRVKALLQVWWGVTGQPPRAGMTAGSLSTRYLDLQLVNRLIGEEGRVAELTGEAPGESMSFWDVISGEADRHRDAVVASLRRIMESECTAHLHLGLREAAHLYSVEPGDSDSPELLNRRFSALLRWDTLHCFGLVAKVTWLINMYSMIRHGGHLGLGLTMVAAGSWLAAHERSGIYGLYGIQSREVPVTVGS